MEQVGERRGNGYDSGFWEQVFALYQQAFEGLPAGIAQAASVGAHWEDVTTPFALLEGGRCLAHVGVISHPMHLGGADPLRVAGIHAVCTAPDRRQQGLSSRLLAAAVAWAATDHEVMKLHTDLPAVYERHGFVAVPTWRFRSVVTPTLGIAKRRLAPSTNAEDASLLQRLLATRAAVSNVCASADDGWMITIDATLGGMLDDSLWYLPDHDAVVVYGEEEGETLVAEVIAQRLPPAAVVAGASPDPQRARRYAFTPDRFEPNAEPFATPAENGVFMVRGRWPVDQPFGISPLWEH
ncbi:MAG: GNAT family N-acetyltransferase [Deltaproteobacteria bacterium]|nr:GNAT family N-acetyltransferase [Deltaproteobacteria bacterium]